MNKKLSLGGIKISNGHFWNSLANFQTNLQTPIILLDAIISQCQTVEIPQKIPPQKSTANRLKRPISPTNSNKFK